MEDPEQDIVPIIHSLTQDPPSLQRATLERYFTRSAAFTHPFCRTGSFDNSRWLILEIYRWYKIISPRIEISVDSVAFDEQKLLLYVGIRQNFRLWFVPGYCADVSLTTVLGLTEDPDEKEPGLTRERMWASTSAVKSNGDRKYWIQSQNDLYQTSEFIKFLVPWGIGWRLIVAWQFLATALCIVGAFLLSPFTVLLERVLGGNGQRVRTRKMLGPD